MKVAFYNHTSVVSGAEISLLLTAKHMTEAEPVLFAPEGELLERARQEGIRTEGIPSYRARMSRNPLKLLKGMAGMAVAGYRFASTVRKRDVDLIHANSLRAGLMASLFAWHHKRPVVWHVRDNPPGGFVGGMIQYVSRKLVDATIGISSAVVSRMDGKGLGTRLHLVHNGVELKPMDDLTKRRHRRIIREEFRTGQDSEVLVIIGQIAPWKRQEDAIRATALLAAEGRDVVLWVVGEAKFRQENIEYGEFLKELAAELGITDRVRFTGFRNDVMEICCAADLLLLCSDNEPFGRVLIEAMSQSLPTVATNAGGVPEIIAHGESGMLYEVGDVDGLTHHLEGLLSLPEERRKMGERAAERVRQLFTIQNTVKKIESIYRGVLEEAQAAGRLKPRGAGQAADRAKASGAAGKDAPRIAIVHDYLNQMGGAERVVGVLHKMYPDAPIFTTIADRSKLLEELKDADIRTTWMQGIPGILKRFKLFFWLYPLAVRSMKLEGYDLIISSSSAYAKGAPKAPKAVHVCYCHTPMRFAWDYRSYMEGVRAPALLKGAARLMQPALRLWDVVTTKRVDHLIANSSIVQKRIEQHYGRSSKIIFPPVNVSRFEETASGEIGDYFLVVSRLVSYKRIDLAVEACTKQGLPLVVVGDGPDRKRLESLAGPTVRFAGRLPDEEVVHLMRGCKAFLFPGLEDFGITPLEANACGRPVVAFRGGGALDTVVPGLNGVYFDRQTAEALAEALHEVDAIRWNPAQIRRHAERFDEARFREELSDYIATALNRKPEAPALPAVAKAQFERSVGS